ncbi:MAG: protoporphyrinogen oxidase HemJ [Janthinobacterium lividum]
MTIAALAPFYPWVKSFHVIAVIAWMAGLFYLPRLYVYHCSVARGSAESERFKVMERRLLKQIMVPAMLFTWLFGLLLVLTPGIVDWSGFNWWHVKFIGVLLMTGFQGAAGKWRRNFMEDRNVKPERFYRFANEVPTVLMVVIVIMAIAKPL